MTSTYHVALEKVCQKFLLFGLPPKACLAHKRSLNRLDRHLSFSKTPND